MFIFRSLLVFLNQKKKIYFKVEWNWIHVIQVMVWFLGRQVWLVVLWKRINLNNVIIIFGLFCIARPVNQPCNFGKLGKLPWESQP